MFMSTEYFWKEFHTEIHFRGWIVIAYCFQLILEYSKAETAREHLHHGSFQAKIRGHMSKQNCHEKYGRYKRPMFQCLGNPSKKVAKLSNSEFERTDAANKSLEVRRTRAWLAKIPFYLERSRLKKVDPQDAIGCRDSVDDEWRLIQKPTHLQLLL